MESPHNSQKHVYVCVRACVRACMCVCVRACVCFVTNAQVIFQPHTVTAYFWYINIPHVTSYSDGEKEHYMSWMFSLVD